MSDIIKVFIEIPEGSNIKYELDEETGEMTVDRIMPTTMGFPTNYGMVQKTHGEDGDALDAYVYLSKKVYPGVVIKCKIIGMLEMEDEEGVDNKLICVPATTKIDALCGAWESLADVPEANKRQLKHFLEHYKDLEPGKWVKLKDYKGIDEASKILKKAQLSFKKITKK